MKFSVSTVVVMDDVGNAHSIMWNWATETRLHSRIRVEENSSIKNAFNVAVL
jgi:hypothetical protein